MFRSSKKASNKHLDVYSASSNYHYFRFRNENRLLTNQRAFSECLRSISSANRIKENLEHTALWHVLPIICVGICFVLKGNGDWSALRGRLGLREFWESWYTGGGNTSLCGWDSFFLPFKQVEERSLQCRDNSGPMLYILQIYRNRLSALIDTKKIPILFFMLTF